MRYQEHAMRAVTRYILLSRAWVDHLVKPLAFRERRNAFSQLTGRMSARPFARNAKHIGDVSEEYLRAVRRRWRCSNCCAINAMQRSHSRSCPIFPPSGLHRPTLTSSFENGESRIAFDVRKVALSINAVHYRTMPDDSRVRRELGHRARAG